MVSGDGPAHCGRIRVADIGLPPDLVEAVEGAGDLVVEADLQSLFPPRSRLAHTAISSTCSSWPGPRG